MGVHYSCSTYYVSVRKHADTQVVTAEQHGENQCYVSLRRFHVMLFASAKVQKVPDFSETFNESADSRGVEVVAHEGPYVVT